MRKGLANAMQLLTFYLFDNRAESFESIETPLGTQDTTNNFEEGQKDQAWWSKAQGMNLSIIVEKSQITPRH